MTRTLNPLSIALLAIPLLAACTDEYGASGEPWNLSTNAADAAGLTDSGPTGGDDGRSDDDSPIDPNKVDMLWVIDNSGSMCEEQATLRENFKGFMKRLQTTPLDFQFAVTTTHNNAFTENVARFGHLQSTPHPLTGFGDTCGSVPNVRDQIEAAIACTKNPDAHADLRNLSSEAIACASGTSEEACEEAGPRWTEDSRTHDLFPCGDADGDGTPCNSRADFDAVYRDLPTVLKTEDYRREPDGSLDVAELQRDFACMSYVGTRGGALEQGLRAATRAVSPEMTGGPAEAPDDPSAPNHGFIRRTARTAVMFVSDENDCSHPEDVDLSSMYPRCGEMGCYFATHHEKSDQSPLSSTSELARRFRENLRRSKGLSSLASDDLVVGSIHGEYHRYTGDIPDTCSNQSRRREEAHVCSTSLGSATSGDRYEDFLRNFETIFPERPDDGGHLPGHMCTRNFGGALSEFAETLRETR